MLFALTWVLIGLLLVFWTAAAWGLHLAAQWLAGLAPAKLEAATTAAGDAARQAVPLLGLPEWLTAGLPAGVVEAWLAWAQSFLPWLQSLLAGTGLGRLAVAGDLGRLGAGCPAAGTRRYAGQSSAGVHHGRRVHCCTGLVGRACSVGAD